MLLLPAAAVAHLGCNGLFLFKITALKKRLLHLKAAFVFICTYTYTYPFLLLLRCWCWG